MEGYFNFRVDPWIRRRLKRILAIIPALLTIQFFGEASTGKLLVLSQVILSMQLGFAIIPLIHFVSEKEKMGEFVIGNLTKTLAWISATILVVLNIKLVFEQIEDLFTTQNLSFFTKSFVLLIATIGLGLTDTIAKTESVILHTPSVMIIL